ncbi:MAG: DUF1847 domain-containing protein [Bacillota bacterium]|nr:DUF1847 domain-containing protein [Bacillota bacterium]
MSKENFKFSCVDCKVCSCEEDDGIYPDFCPTAALMDGEMESSIFDEAVNLYVDDDEINRVTVAAAEVELENYCKMTRVEEIAEFARKIGAKKLGIATCIGLIKESAAAAKIFRNRGFEVYGVCCKVGAVPKIAVGLDMTHETLGKNMCNPILQAKLLNEEKTDLNIVVGLCVGHDSLFYRYSDALCTTLVTKDRVLGHNPVAALYQTDSYYKKLL